MTHIKADFDAMASAYAAFKLYECDHVLICTSPESNVSNFLTLEKANIPIINLNEEEILNFSSEIEFIVITDCKVLNRLGHLKNLVPKAIQTVVVDHHPARGLDIPSDTMILEEVGATTTILAEKIFEKNIKLTTFDATFLLLGIYEDTGFLTFSSTTSRDLAVCGKLLDAGANINQISSYIKKDLNKNQIHILNELLLNLSFYMKDGMRIHVSHASIESYVGDISYLAHRIMDIENLDCLFILVRTGDRVILVARSNNEKIEASSIAAYFGGGGHLAAASATIKNMTLNEAIEQLKVALNKSIQHTKSVKDIMTYPIKTVGSNQTFDIVNSNFMKYNLNILPVIEKNKTIGLISRQDILHGIKHGMGSDHISAIMQTDFKKATLHTPFYEIEDIIIGQNQSLVPIENEKEIIGIITKTDLMRSMYDDFMNKPAHMDMIVKRMGHPKIKNLKHLMKDRLPIFYFDLLTGIGNLADTASYNIFVVGGFVRDLIMQNENLDIDIVVEGDAPTITKKFAKKNNAKVSVHNKFKTAVVILNNDTRIDFATARTEYYNFPAAAPVIENSSIKVDLYRRDFTINSMAIKLNSDDFGLLIDYFGGQIDIKDKKIRVLHNLSFIDDPTRGLRAIRFAARFNFQIGPHTRKLLKHSVDTKIMERVPGFRLFNELISILSEKSYVKAIKILKSFNTISFFSDKINLDSEKYKKFDFLNRITDWFTFQFSERLQEWKPRFCILFSELKYSDFLNLSKKLELSSVAQDDLMNNFLKAKSAAVKLKKEKELKPSKIYEVLHEMKNEYIILTGVLMGEKYEKVVNNFFTQYKGIKLNITGNDLIKLGYKPSKKFGIILDKVLKLKIDGHLKSYKGELDAAKEIFKNQ